LISVLENILLLLTAKMGLKDSKMDWKIMGKKKRICIKLGKFTNSLKKSAHVVLLLRKIDPISRETYSLRVK